MSIADHWSEISDIFAAALDLEPSARAAFVEQHSKGNFEVQQEVLRLLALSEHPDDFLDGPTYRIIPDSVPTPDSLLIVGDLVADRFRILTLLGRGGMGDVYEAEDAILGDIVALKVVRPGPESAAELGIRLRREVQLARRVSHPGVCRVHDVAIHTSADGHELILLTMEIVKGETLAARIRRGPIPADEALELAGQLAAALDAAHSQRVLHRDVKPGNIMLAPRDDGGTRAVLTDFGLARASEGATAGTVTRTGAVVGTPEYMAPEQLRGDPATVQSDLYSFGLVLCEMLTGVRTTVGSLSPDILSPRLVAVSSGKSRRTRLWTMALTRALDPRPEGRFRNAREMVDALSGLSSQAVRHRHVSRRGFVLGACALVLVALSAGLARLYIQSQPRLTPASQVLLTPTANGTSEPDLDGAGEILKSQLQQSPHFELIPKERVTNLLRQMNRAPDAPLEAAVAREIAMREGAPLVVYSSVTRVGPEYMLGLRLERVGARPSLIRASWTRTFSASGRSQLFDVFHDAAVWIRQTVGENASDLADQDRPSSDTTTSSWEALRLMANADARQDRGELADAALLLENAIRLDPDFAMGHMRLADVLISLKRDREGYAQWREAVQLLDRRLLTSRESLRIKGQYLEDTGDLLGAEKAYRTYLAHYPNDYFAVFFLGSVLHDLGHTSEAVPFLSRAAALRPASFVAPVHLVTAQLDLGEFDLAAAGIAALRQHQHTDWATWLTGLAIFARGNAEGALQAIEPLEASTDLHWRSRAFTLRASWLSESGRYSDAASELKSGIAFDEAQGLRDRATDKWLQLAALDVALGDVPGSVDAAMRAVNMEPNAKQLALAGIVLVRAGRVNEAEGLIDTLDRQPDLPRVRIARDRLMGEIRLARNKPVEALALLERAAAMGPQRESRVALARALSRTGDYARARQLLLAVVEHRTRPYSAPEPELPGPWSEAMREVAALDAADRTTR